MTYLFIVLQAVQSNNQPVISNWTIIAAVAAAISAFSAFKSRGYAKSAYELARQNYADRQTNFDLYLIDGYRWANKDGAKKFLLFHITINNKSDSKNSFSAELEIEYIKDNDSVARVIVKHNEKHHSQIPQKDITAFPNDIRIEERAMQSKWLIFEQPITVFSNYKIEKYLIRLTDIQGHVQEVSKPIIKDLSDVQ